jgi:hypothetical protein
MTDQATKAFLIPLTRLVTRLPGNPYVTRKAPFGYKKTLVPSPVQVRIQHHRENRHRHTPGVESGLGLRLKLEKSKFFQPTYPSFFNTHAESVFLVLARHIDRKSLRLG